MVFWICRDGHFDLQRSIGMEDFRFFELDFGHFEMDDFEFFCWILGFFQVQDSGGF